MEVRSVPISSLKAAPYNPRKKLDPKDKEYRDIERSIKEFDLVEPLIWNKRTGNLVGGHQRLQVLKDQGLTNVDVSVVDLPEKKEKALNIALNKISGQWKIPELKDLLVDLDDGEFDLSLTGFDEHELKELVDYTPMGKQGLTEDDAVSETPTEAKTKPGDLYILGNHRLLCGDATRREDVIQVLNSQQAQLCFTSPPYSDQRVYAKEQNVDPSHISEFIGCAEPSCECFVINLGLSRRDHEINTYWDIYIESARNCRLKLLSWNVWNKGEGGSIGNQTAMFSISHEWIFVFGKDRFNLNRTVRNKCAGEKTHGSISIRHQDGSLTPIAPEDRNIVGQYKQLSTVLSLSPLKERNYDLDHPAMFPVRLPACYIEACTQEGDVVYEPFLGSGSTLIASEKLNRRCFGLEIEPKYCDVIVKRWEDFTGKKAQLVRKEAVAA